MADADLDEPDLGVIGCGVGTAVRRNNAFESKAAGLWTARVRGWTCLAVVPPGLDSALVAQRFEDAAAEGNARDATIDQRAHAAQVPRQGSAAPAGCTGGGVPFRTGAALEEGDVSAHWMSTDTVLDGDKRDPEQRGVTGIGPRKAP